LENFSIKKAGEKDVPIILNFIKLLSVYEKLEHEVDATEEKLAETIFGGNSNVECIIGYIDAEPVAFALYFFNYSTFKAKHGLYLEDIFVLPEMRGKGIGKTMLLRLAQIAKENNCGRFEWSVLKWNKPAVDFYLSLGAKPLDEWTVFRLDENAISKLIN